MSSVNNPRFGNENPAPGVMECVKKGAENVASSVSSAAEQAWDATREGAQQVAHAAETAWDSTREGAQQVAHAAETAWDSTNDFMRRYPFVALGIGMCMGFTLCLALHGRRA
jgi:ElaB/YqjD/DUF883 family membrane-anchored ribosome-binding protein